MGRAGFLALGFSEEVLVAAQTDDPQRFAKAEMRCTFADMDQQISHPKCLSAASPAALGESQLAAG